MQWRVQLPTLFILKGQNYYEAINYRHQNFVTFCMYNSVFIFMKKTLTQQNSLSFYYPLFSL